MKAKLSILVSAFLAITVSQTNSASAVPTYWGGNGHYYELITGNFTFGQALTQAASMSHLGETGHLVTITSAAEQTFLNGLTGSTLYYIGAADTGTEGDWKWVAGPEAGESFWISGTTQPGYYSNWSFSEPNDLGGNEDFAVANWGFGGTWNDINGTQTLAYVVEYSINVPEPGTLAAFGAGLAALGLAARRRRKTLD